jgi:uncharacterized protein (DUF433 family)
MTKEATIHHERITRDPKVMVGKPVVTGTRIPVELVLEELADNPDLDELFAAHPGLTVEDVQACLAYAKELVGEQKPRRPRVTPGGPVRMYEVSLRSEC